MQMVSSADKTSAVVVSTLMEAWSVVRAGLFKDGTIQDVSNFNDVLEGTDPQRSSCTGCR